MGFKMRVIQVGGRGGKVELSRLPHVHARKVHSLAHSLAASKIQHRSHPVIFLASPSSNLSVTQRSLRQPKSSNQQ